LQLHLGAYPRLGVKPRSRYSKNRSWRKDIQKNRTPSPQKNLDMPLTSLPLRITQLSSISSTHLFQPVRQTNCILNPHFFQNTATKGERMDAELSRSVVIEKFHKLSLNFYINFYHNNRFTFHMNKFIKTRKKIFFCTFTRVYYMWQGIFQWEINKKKCS